MTLRQFLRRVVVRYAAPEISRLKSRLVATLTYIIDRKLLVFSMVYVVSNTILISYKDLFFSGKYILVPGILFTGSILLFIFSHLGVHRYWYTSKKEFIFTVFVLIASIAFSSLRVAYDLNSGEKSRVPLSAEVGKPLQEKGVIIEDPEYSHDSVKLIINVRNSNVLVKAPRFPRVKLGDLCNVSGVLEKPKSFSDFDYEKYLWNKRIFFVLNNARIDCGSDSETSLVLMFHARIYDFKMQLVGRILQSMPEPQGSLLAGILFGYKGIFSDNFEEALQVSGTTHVISASGYNVSFVVLILDKVFYFVGKRYRNLFIIVGIWLYSIMCGGNPSIIRACIMQTLVLLAHFSGSKISVHWVLPLSVFIFILFDPRIVFSISFLLSVLSTAGLIYILPCIEVLSKKLEEKFGVNVDWFFVQGIGATLSCTLATLPMTISIFNDASTVAIFSNMLVLPFIESTMLVGVVALVFSYISFRFSLYIFTFLWLQLKYFELVVNFFAKIPWASVPLNPSSEIAFVSIFYILLFVFILILYPVEPGDNFYLNSYHAGLSK